MVIPNKISKKKMILYVKIDVHKETIKAFVFLVID